MNLTKVPNSLNPTAVNDELLLLNDELTETSKGPILAGCRLFAYDSCGRLRLTAWGI